MRTVSVHFIQDKTTVPYNSYGKASILSIKYFSIFYEYRGNFRLIYRNKYDAIVIGYQWLNWKFLYVSSKGFIPIPTFSY